MSPGYRLNRFVNYSNNKPVPWLITGVSGLLGSNAFLGLDQCLPYGISRHIPPNNSERLFSIDLLEHKLDKKLTTLLTGGVIFHSAALSSIEECRRNPGLAQRMNVEVPIWLARTAKEIDAKFVFISTDAVFDGLEGNYSEQSPTNPISIYGETKVSAEKGVLEVNPEALVARVNFFGWSPIQTRSVVEYFVNNLEKGNKVNGFTDITVSTSYVKSLLMGIKKLVDLDKRGIYHVTNSESISKYNLAVAIAERFGFDQSLIKPVNSSSYLTDQRGKNMSLNTSKFKNTTGQFLPGIYDDINSLFLDRDEYRKQITLLHQL